MSEALQDEVLFSGEVELSDDSCLSGMATLSIADGLDAINNNPTPGAQLDVAELEVGKTASEVIRDNIAQCAICVGNPLVVPSGAECFRSLGSFMENDKTVN